MAQQGTAAPAAQAPLPTENGAAAAPAADGKPVAGTLELPSAYQARDDLRDAPGYRLLHSMSGAHGGGAVTSLRFDRAGLRLASGGTDGTAAIWDVDSGRELHRLRGHTSGISDVAWSPDGALLATASDDTTLRVWDAASGVCLRVLRGHTHYVSCCAFSSGSNLLVSGGYDETIRVWDVRHARNIKIIPGHSDPVSGVALSGEPGLGELIASCSFDGMTRVWHTGTGRCQASLTDSANPALASVRFTPNGRFLLTATLDGRMLLWDYRQRKVKKTYKGHVNKHSCCQATFVINVTGDKLVACGSEDHHVYLYDLQNRSVVGLLRGRPTADAPGDGHCSIVLSVDAAMEAGRQFIASGGHHGDGAVKVWAHDSVGGGSGGPSPMDAS